MKEMMRQVMENAGLTLWPVLSLLVFTISSAVILAWMYRPGARKFYGDLAHMALDGQQEKRD
jgi:cbb3-type cytochrome oxidase subunit 3